MTDMLLCMVVPLSSVVDFPSCCFHVKGILILYLLLYYFEILFIFILCVWCFTCMYVCATCVQRLKRPERSFYLMELELQVPVSPQVGAGNRTLVLLRSSQCSQMLNHF